VCACACVCVGVCMYVCMGVCMCVCQTREIAQALGSYGHSIPAYVNITVWRLFSFNLVLGSHRLY
jgi:hypothetical protein